MSTAVEIEKFVCPQCYAVLDVGDNFCRRCGLPTGDSAHAYATPAEVVPEARGNRSSWMENRWVVLAMLFLVLGPVGLPMLWRSRQFSLTWKLLLTAVVLAITAVILGLIWYVVQQSLAPLRELRY